jgi:stringent starvation protein A
VLVAVAGRWSAKTPACCRTFSRWSSQTSAAIVNWLAERLGDAPWFGVETFGWADAAVAPLLHRSVLNGMGPAPDTTLAAWYQRLLERPSVAATFAEYAAAAGRMPAILDAFRSGAKVREYRDYRLEWMIRSGGMEVVLAGLRAGTIRFSWPHA